MLRSDALELVFDPEQGGKWRSLTDLRTGQEWLWKNPHLSFEAINHYDSSFIEKLDTGGWDEIFPSVLPCGTIPDHGDLVRIPWTTDAVEDNQLTLSVTGHCLPFCFERTVVLNGSEILCKYRLENTGREPFPWLWCAHPLLSFSPGLTVDVDAELNVLSGQGAAAGLKGQTVHWNTLPSRQQKWAVKLFSGHGAVNTVTVHQANGSSLRMEWDVQEIPYLGLWINNGAWSGCGSQPYHNIGIEPAMLPVDDLSSAEAPPILNGGQTAEWTLKTLLF